MVAEIPGSLRTEFLAMPSTGRRRPARVPSQSVEESQPPRLPPLLEKPVPEPIPRYRAGRGTPSVATSAGHQAFEDATGLARLALADNRFRTYPRVAQGKR